MRVGSAITSAALCCVRRTHSHRSHERRTQARRPCVVEARPWAGGRARGRGGGDSWCCLVGPSIASLPASDWRGTAIRPLRSNRTWDEPGGRRSTCRVDNYASHLPWPYAHAYLISTHRLHARRGTAENTRSWPSCRLAGGSPSGNVPRSVQATQPCTHSHLRHCRRPVPIHARVGMLTYTLVPTPSAPAGWLACLPPLTACGLSRSYICRVL